MSKSKEAELVRLHVPLSWLALVASHARQPTRVYTRVGDVFKDADVHSFDELLAARRAAVIRDDDGEDPS